MIPENNRSCGISFIPDGWGSVNRFRFIFTAKDYTAVIVEPEQHEESILENWDGTSKIEGLYTKRTFRGLVKDKVLIPVIFINVKLLLQPEYSRESRSFQREYSDWKSGSQIQALLWNTNPSEQITSRFHSRITIRGGYVGLDTDQYILSGKNYKISKA